MARHDLKPIKRPFAALVKKRKIDKTEAAMLKASMRLDRQGMIFPDEFERQRERILGSPAGG